MVALVKTLLVIVVLLGLVVFYQASHPPVATAPGGAQAPVGPPPLFRTPSVPVQAPDFTLRSTAGADVHLKDMLARGPVLLCFFKTECPTSRIVLPKYETFQSYYAATSRGFQVLGVAQNAPEEAADYARAQGLTFPIVVDREPFPVSAQYGLLNTPTLVLVGSDGKTLAVVANWDRARINELARTIASLAKVAYRDISTDADGLPPMRPG